MAKNMSLEVAACGRGVVPAFQPMVTLDSGDVFGFEALARWPKLTHVSTSEVFRHARAAGNHQKLNRRCARTALRVAVEADLPVETLITINHEPDSPYPEGVGRDLLTRARDQLTLGFEITERGMLSHPKHLLATVAAMRRDGFLVILDDVGAHPDSLALLDIVEPDIIKLDMELVQHQPRSHQARTITAVLAHQERTNTPILAEGIENDAHLEQALAVGATMGQGFKYGHPGPIGSTPPTSRRWRRSTTSGRRAPVPFDLIEHSSAKRRVGAKRVLMALTDHIEVQASNTADPPIVLTALQQRQYFTPATARRYAKLSQTCPLVAVFGEQLPARLGNGVRGVPLEPDDPLCAEWTVVALGPQLAVALIAREVPSVPVPTAEDDRQFDFILTFERGLVTQAAHSLLERMR